MDGKSCRYFLMGAYTLPRGGKEEVWDEEIDGLAPGSWKVPQRVQAMWRVTIDNDTGEVLESVEVTNLEEDALHRLLDKSRNLKTILFYEKGNKGQEGEIQDEKGRLADYWTKSIDGRMVIRVHKSHRKGKFYPEKAEECPGTHRPAGGREAQAKSAAYVTVTDDWRTAGTGERLFEDDSRWAGRTIFMIKGATDPQPRPELVIEEEEYEPELPPLEAGDWDFELEDEAKELEDAQNPAEAEEEEEGGEDEEGLPPLPSSSPTPPDQISACRRAFPDGSSSPSPLHI